ncbi:MAG: hypothetical protein NC395_09350 [Prevotella sp.]|nr:hypothetical protein [Prevotella sp.]
MPEWIQWVFSGLGTELVSLAIGAILGGIVGVRIGKHKRKLHQIQKAGKESEQYQKGTLRKKINNEKSEDVISSFTQKQIAGDNSKQTQIGGQDDA